MTGDFFFVAGPGIEPGSGGYEPPEVPLLYPAVLCVFGLIFYNPLSGSYETYNFSSTSFWL